MGTFDDSLNLSQVRLDCLIEAYATVKDAGNSIYWVEYDNQTDLFVFYVNPLWREGKPRRNVYVSWLDPKVIITD